MIEILNKIIQSSIYQNLNSEIDIRDINWRTEQAKQHDILFYRLNDNSEQSLSNFKNRIKNSTYAVLVTNLFDKKLETLPNLIVVKDSFWLEAQKIILDFLYPLPSDIRLVGITGTNGKTTTVDILAQLAKLNKFSNITIGTLGLRKDGKQLEDFGLTTPSFIDLRKYLHCYGKDTKLFFIEASSHALVQQRFYGLQFDVSGWTSFSQDHLDYHKTMDEYFNAKKSIIDITKSKQVYISSHSKELLGRLKDAQICSTFNGKIHNSFFKARHNLINLEIALAILAKLGINVELKQIANISPPPGRFDIIEYKDNYIIIDFAHTPDALKNICLSIKNSFPDYELVTLFGCGGDRDKTKRPLMGNIAQMYSERVIVTSDNPRFERPEDIINDILSSMKRENLEVITDRKVAIGQAVKNLNKSILLIAGKGHEQYMDISGVKVPYSDEQVVRDIISNE